MGDFWADPAFWAGIGISILAYVVGGVMHILIDYVHGKRLLRTYWDATDQKIAGIEDKVVDKLKGSLPVAPKIPEFPHVPTAAEIAAAIPRLELPHWEPPNIALEFETFLRSEPGVTWARELASLAAGQFEASFLKKATDRKGSNARSQQATIERTLLDNLKFGDRRMDAIWAILDDDVRRDAVRRIAAVIHRAGFVLIPMGDVSIAPELVQLGPGESGPPGSLDY